MKQRTFGRNFMLLAAGQAGSLLVNSVLDLALSMYVLEQTGSAVIYGSMLAVAMIPGILLAPLGGVLADRADRRRLMVWLDGLSGIIVLGTLPFLQGKGGIWAAGTLMVLLSVLGAVETPVVQASLPQVVQGEGLERANAVVLQISMLCAMIGPALGGALFGGFGVVPVLLFCALCFLCTAGFEGMIRLEPVPQPPAADSLGRTVLLDLKASGTFLCRRQPALLRLLALVAILGLLSNGVAGVGAPYLIRTRLGLSAGWYGAAGSALGAFGVAGSLAAGMLAGRLRPRYLSGVLILMGVCLLPASAVFLMSDSPVVCYGALVAALCGMQLCAVVFSVFVRSVMQRQVPAQLIGKVMAFAMALESCGQPVGQFVYGALFNQCPAGWVLMPTGMLLVILGLTGQKLFQSLEEG